MTDLTLAQAAAYLGIGRSTLTRVIKEGRGPRYVEIPGGKTIRQFNTADLDAWKQFVSKPKTTQRRRTPTRNRWALTDAQWESVRLVLGKRNSDARPFIDLVIWCAINSVDMANIPASKREWQLFSGRVRRWTTSGTWLRVFSVLQQFHDFPVRLVWGLSIEPCQRRVASHVYAAGTDIARGVCCPSVQFSRRNSWIPTGNKNVVCADSAAWFTLYAPEAQAAMKADLDRAKSMPKRGKPES